MTSGPATPTETPQPVAEAPTDTTPAMSKDDRDQAIRAEYSAVTTWLREQHLTEFQAEMKKRLAERGIDWTPRLTKAERAKEQIAKLAAEAGLKVTVA
jgi:hypothetical protein